MKALCTLILRGRPSSLSSTSFSRFSSSVQAEIGTQAPSASTVLGASDAEETKEAEEEEDDEYDPDFDIDEDDIYTGRRLSKMMAETNYISRLEAERLIKQRRVTFKGKVVKSQFFKAEPSEFNLVEIDGVPLKRHYTVPSGAMGDHPRTPTRYLFPHLFVMNKYRFESMNTTPDDPKKHDPRALLINRVDYYLPQIFSLTTLRPVYRLPFIVEGLVLYTNNGELARLFHNHQLDYTMTWRVRVHGMITPAKLAALKEGSVHLKNGRKLVKCEDLIVEKKLNTNTWLQITTTVKDFKEIDLTFKTLFLDINRCVCLGFGPIKLNEVFPDLFKQSKRKKGHEVKLLIQRRKVKSHVDQFDLETSNAFTEIPLPVELHQLFMRFQNNKMGRGTVQSRPVPESVSVVRDRDGMRGKEEDDEDEDEEEVKRPKGKRRSDTRNASSISSGRGSASAGASSSSKLSSRGSGRLMTSGSGSSSGRNVLKNRIVRKVK
jgi:23S rRNA pseudouridine2605 synthase